MSTGSAEERIRELARDLAPVRPIPPLGAALGAALAAGGVALAVQWLLGGPGLRHGGSAVASASYVATLVGLVLVALGALGAALAAAVPGREAAARRGAFLAAAGGLIAIGGALWDIVPGRGLGAETGLTECLSCIGYALALGAAPVLLALAFIVYAALRRPAVGTALALTGGVALGAAAVHAICPIDGPKHWLLGHTLAPLAAALLLTGPLAMLLARRTRRDRPPPR